MDTKLKESETLVHSVRKRNPFFPWLSFTTGSALMVFCLTLFLAGLAYSQGNMDALKALFSDYKQTIPFKEQTHTYFSILRNVATSDMDQDSIEYWKDFLDAEGVNIKYAAINLDDESFVSNMGGDFDNLLKDDGMPRSVKDYGYVWFFDGNKGWVLDGGKTVDTKRLDSGYRGLGPEIRADDEPRHKAILFVKDELVENPYARSDYYVSQRYLGIMKYIFTGILGLGIMLLAYGIFRYQDKRRYDQKVASFLSGFWIEVKAFLTLCGLLVVPGVTLYIGYGFSRFSREIIGVGGASFYISLLFIWVYLMGLDLTANRRQFFANNSFNWLIRKYRDYERKESWQKMMLKRAYVLLISVSILALLSVYYLMMGTRYRGHLFLLSLALAAIGLYLIYRYLRRYGRTVEDLGLLLGRIKEIKNGEFGQLLSLDEDADIYPAAKNLNAIQEGMDLAVRERVKSEQMKIDLITNVSHDLKTPLTSIVSYVELLEKEKNLPGDAEEYVRILGDKTKRLQSLIQDLFDLSKATSGDVMLNAERLDLNRLLLQVLADMEELIEQSGLTFKVELPETTLYVQSDGKKLHRIFQNLISNALKYSLKGTRVFIEAKKMHDKVFITIKNTANYEIEFTEDEILERFARGDRSRSTEGSGLGLSIAKSFTEALGGQFRIDIDGDLFKVELRFVAE